MSTSPYWGQASRQAALFAVAGACTALLTMGVFLVAGPAKVWVDTAALLAGAVAVLCLLAALHIATPSRPILRGLAVAGLVTALVAVAMVARVGPWDPEINVTWTPAILLFMAGGAAILAATFAAWFTPVQTPIVAPATAEAQVEADIEEVTKAFGTSWAFQRDGSFADRQIAALRTGTVRGSNVGRTVQMDGARVEEPLAALRQTRPSLRRPKEVAGDWSEEGAKVLVEVRRQRVVKPGRFAAWRQRRLERRQAQVAATPPKDALPAVQEAIMPRRVNVTQVTVAAAKGSSRALKGARARAPGRAPAQTPKKSTKRASKASKPAKRVPKKTTKKRR